jgi:hypothetical protein
MKDAKKRPWRLIGDIFVFSASLFFLFNFWHEGKFYFPFEASEEKAWVVKSYVESKRTFFKNENVQHIIYDYEFESTEYAGMGELRSIYAVKGDTVKIEVLRRNPSVSKLLTK